MKINQFYHQPSVATIEDDDQSRGNFGYLGILTGESQECEVERGPDQEIEGKDQQGESRILKPNVEFWP